MPDFPVAVTDLPDASESETLLTMHAGVSHVTASNRLIANVRNLSSKIGISASSPVANTVLGATGIGSSAFRKATASDIDPGATPNRLLRASAANVASFGQLADADVAAGTIGLTKLVPGTSGVLKSNGSAISAGNAVLAGDINTGGVNNGALRATGSSLAGFGLVQTADIAAGAATGFWSVVGVPTNYAGTPQNSISGASLSVSMAGANPLLIGVTLVNIFNLTAAATLTVEIWEGVGAVHSVGQLAINTSELRGMAKTIGFAPTAGAHTYFLTWAVSAGTVSAGGYSFWAMEIRR